MKSSCFFDYLKLNLDVLENGNWDVANGRPCHSKTFSLVLSSLGKSKKKEQDIGTKRGGNSVKKRLPLNELNAWRHGHHAREKELAPTIHTIFLSREIKRGAFRIIYHPTFVIFN